MSSLPRAVSCPLYYAWNIGSSCHILFGSGITGEQNESCFGWWRVDGISTAPFSAQSTVAFSCTAVLPALPIAVESLEFATAHVEEGRVMFEGAATTFNPNDPVHEMIYDIIQHGTIPGPWKFSFLLTLLYLHRQSAMALP